MTDQLPIQPLEVTSPALHEAWYRRTFPPVEQVRAHIWSIPIPFAGNPMRYTLCYALIGDGGEAVLIDPGWDSPEGFEALQAGLRTAGLELGAVAGILITHMHPDHHGLTHYLADAVPGAWIAMSETEADALEAQQSETQEQQRAAVRAQLSAAGIPSADAIAAVRRGGGSGVFERMPRATLRLADGDLVPLPGHELRAVLTPGHTAGHLCFVEPAADVVFTGDHVLPRISPNVGLHAHSATSPLGAYLASLAKIGAIDHEVLPAHQWRFRGLPERTAELREHHRERLDEILGHLEAGPVTVWDLAHGLTWAHGWETLNPMQQWSAVAETTAHLTYLIERGAVSRSGEAPVLYALAARAE